MAVKVKTKPQVPPKFDVKWVPVGDVKRYTNNPRHNAGAVEGVRRSLDEFGWRQPIVVDQGMTIVVGDTRYQAALARGDTEVPVHVADLTTEQARRYRLADNRVAESSYWDDARLLGELRGIAGIEAGAPDLSDLFTGFAERELAALVRKLEPETPPEFPSVTGVTVDYQCPKCGYGWSGKAK